MGRRVLLFLLLLALAAVGGWLLRWGPPRGGAPSVSVPRGATEDDPGFEPPRLEGRLEATPLVSEPMAGTANGTPASADGESAMGDAEGSGPQPGRVLRGRVVDEAGRGVPDARVSGWAPIGGGPFRFWWEHGKVATAADGSFRLAMPAGRVRVRVYAAPANSASVSLEVTEEEGLDLVLHVVREPNVGGRVLDVAGEPAAGVSVWLEYGGDTERTTSDGHGRFTFRLPPGAEEVGVVAGAREWQAGSQPEVLGNVRYGVEPGTMDLELRLCTPVWIQGTVPGEDGVALPSGLVSARRLGEGPRIKPLTGVIDTTTGGFRLGPLRPGPWRLVAQPSDVRYAVSEATDVVAPADDVEILCPRALSIRGVVRGDEVAGFAVAWVDEGHPLGRQVSTTRVAPDGSFEIFRLRRAPHRLYVWRRDDSRMAELEGVWPGPEAISIDLAPGLSIRGRVAGGQPTKGSRALAARRGVQVDALVADDGSFTICGLASGTWTLDVTTKTDDFELAHGVGEAIEAGEQGVVIGE